ncbi:hypothetical protein F4860DRAFT_471528, partial [Xylaria cubensis]
MFATYNRGWACLGRHRWHALIATICPLLIYPPTLLATLVVVVSNPLTRAIDSAFRCSNKPLLGFEMDVHALVSVNGLILTGAWPMT